MLKPQRTPIAEVRTPAVAEVRHPQLATKAAAEDARLREADLARRANHGRPGSKRA